MEEKSFKERRRENRDPLPYTIYKGVKGSFGAIRIELKKAYTDNRREKDDGCVFLSMAPAVGANRYDWEDQKITMKLGLSDVSKVILYLRNPNHSTFQTEKANGNLSLYHDRGAGTQSRGLDTTALNISKPEDRNNFFFSSTRIADGRKHSASVPVSADEAIIIGTLLQAAIPLVLAWEPGQHNS